MTRTYSLRITFKGELLVSVLYLTTVQHFTERTPPRTLKCPYPWPEISDMKTARARILGPIWPRNIQRVCMTSIRQNEIEGVVAHLEHLPRSL